MRTVRTISLHASLVLTGLWQPDKKTLKFMGYISEVHCSIVQFGGFRHRDHLGTMPDYLFANPPVSAGQLFWYFQSMIRISQNNGDKDRSWRRKKKLTVAKNINVCDINIYIYKNMYIYLYYTFMLYIMHIYIIYIYIYIIKKYPKTMKGMTARSPNDIFRKQNIVRLYM